MQNNFSIEVKNIRKVFSYGFPRKSVTALDDVSLNVDKGLIYGLLGQNGAGKTTLIKILLGIINPTSGGVRILGQDPSPKLRRQIGYLPENARFPEHLTGRQALISLGKFYGLDDQTLKTRVEEMLVFMQLDQAAQRKIITYSKGMQQRLGLALAMLHDPEILFLDEPTDGMDPVGRKQVRDALLNLKEKGKTVFINSHILSEVELITDSVTIMSRGVIVKEGTIKELTDTTDQYRVTVTSFTLEQYKTFAEHALKVTRIGEYLLQIDVKNVEQLNEFIDHLRANNITVQDISKNRKSLEQVYLSSIQEARN
jgi:ABC-2 type transport system ATP-binding protein